ncbi:potassium channel family protein [Carboxylicivirga linearis]|uniref:Potassium channel domain-containing protein n=1 Tax=Carboxylicivirga linearis TaxID=1628157 RepID=A0ABS5K0I8_9BACT|nr:potassium channel family protein [Carboxylicivirga linearis]MBS2100609.1 hypothetical protein [Carboxylicivirga linearis]
MLKNWIIPWIKKFQLRISNYGLFAVILFTLFILPFITNLFTSEIFDICLVVIITISVYATSENKSIIVIFQVIIILAVIGGSRLLNLTVLYNISRLLLVFFFLNRVFRFIGQVSKKKDISLLTIIEAINGYLLLGIAFGSLIEFTLLIQTGAFNFTSAELHFYDPFYYSFVTMSTLGYGDLLPQIPQAKAIAIFVTLCGQIYLVTIMAFLIGRLLSLGDKSDS